MIMEKLDINHIAHLARINLSTEESEKLSGDLDKVLGHFEELSNLDTEGVLPMAGGTDLVNVFRTDDDAEQSDTEVLCEAFPDEKDGYLRVPRIFGE